MKKLILCSLFIFITSCTAAPTAPSANTTEIAKEDAKEVVRPTETLKTKAKSCICTKMWMPVCGENKKTYGNSCEADCAGVKYTGGACAETK